MGPAVSRETRQGASRMEHVPTSVNGAAATHRALLRRLPLPTCLRGPPNTTRQHAHTTRPSSSSAPDHVLTPRYVRAVESTIAVVSHAARGRRPSGTGHGIPARTPPVMLNQKRRGGVPQTRAPAVWVARSRKGDVLVGIGLSVPYAGSGVALLYGPHPGLPHSRATRACAPRGDRRPTRFHVKRDLGLDPGRGRSPLVLGRGLNPGRTSQAGP